MLKVNKTRPPLPKGRYRPMQLVDKLNEVVKQKKTGKPFKYIDVYTYAKRNRLPRFYGGNEIERFEEFGVVFYRLTNPCYDVQAALAKSEESIFQSEVKKLEKK